MTPEQQAVLLARVGAEIKAAGVDYVIPLHLDLDLCAIMSLVGVLQLALSHPALTGTPAGELSRTVVDLIIGKVEAEGFAAITEILRSGDHLELNSSHMTS